MRDMRHSHAADPGNVYESRSDDGDRNTEDAKDILQQKEKILDLGIKMRKIPCRTCR